MTNEQFEAVKEFTESYQDVISHSSMSKDPIGKYVIEYAVKVLEIHLELARIKREQDILKEVAFCG